MLSVLFITLAEGVLQISFFQEYSNQDVPGRHAGEQQVALIVGVAQKAIKNPSMIGCLTYLYKAGVRNGEGMDA